MNEGAVLAHHRADATTLGFRWSAFQNGFTTAAVIAAKVIWKLMKTYSLMTSSLKVAAVLSASVPVRKALPQLKKALPSGPKAVE